MNRETFDSLWSPIEGCPAQDREELFWLVNKVEGLKPNTILEIGVARGGTLRYWEQLVPKDGLVLGIEINPQVYQQIEEWWDWRKSDRQLDIVLGDSLHLEIVSQVERLRGNRQFDFVFIDGNHDPWYIFNEFVVYGEMVRYGGLIGFHDIRPEMHLQYVFDKLRGRTERYLKQLGIGIYWKDKMDDPLIFQRHDNSYSNLDLDDPQSKRLNDVWRSIKLDHWRE